MHLYDQTYRSHLISKRQAIYSTVEEKPEWRTTSNHLLYQSTYDKLIWNYKDPNLTLPWDMVVFVIESRT